MSSNEQRLAIAAQTRSSGFAFEASRNFRNEFFSIIRSPICPANIEEGALLTCRRCATLLPSSMSNGNGELSRPMGDTEKRDIAFVGEVADTDFAEINERRLLRKIDFRIVPWLSLLYLLNSLDRSNIGNSRVSAC